MASYVVAMGRSGGGAASAAAEGRMPTLRCAQSSMAIDLVFMVLLASSLRVWIDPFGYPEAYTLYFSIGTSTGEFYLKMDIAAFIDFIQCLIQRALFDTRPDRQRRFLKQFS